MLNSLPCPLMTNTLVERKHCVFQRNADVDLGATAPTIDRKAIPEGPCGPRRTALLRHGRVLGPRGRGDILGRSALNCSRNAVSASNPFDGPESMSRIKGSMTYRQPYQEVLHTLMYTVRVILKKLQKTCLAVCLRG